MNRKDFSNDGGDYRRGPGRGPSRGFNPNFRGNTSGNTRGSYQQGGGGGGNTSQQDYNNNRPNFPRTCYKCQKEGHIARECDFQGGNRETHSASPNQTARSSNFNRREDGSGGARGGYHNSPSSGSFSSSSNSSPNSGSRGRFPNNAQSGYNNFQSGRPNPRNQPMPESEQHEVLCQQSMGGGQEGDTVDLVSNFFKISSSKAVSVYQYSITIKRAETGGEEQQQQQPPQHQQQQQRPFVSQFDAFLKKASPEIIEKYIAQNSGVFGIAETRFGLIHDGAQSLYSTQELPIEQLAELQEMELQGRRNSFAISLALVSTIDLGEVERFYASKQGESGEGGGSKQKKTTTSTTPKCPSVVSTKVLPVYEQLFRCLVQGKFTAHQRNFYDLADRRTLYCNRSFDSVAGFSTSTRLTEIGLALNLHHKSAVVVSNQMETVQQLVASYLKLPSKVLADLKQGQIRRASKLLGGLRIKTTYGRREMAYIIDSLVPERADEYTFTLEDGTDTTVQEYYLKTFNIEVGPYPLVRTKSDVRRRPSASEAALPAHRREKIHLPMEVCQLLPDQFLLEQRQPPDVQTELLGMACLQPNVYFNKVVDFVQRIKQIDPVLLAHFGVELSSKPVKLQARRLPLPTVFDGSEKIRSPPKYWSGFYQPAAAPKKWAVFCFDSSVTKEGLTKFYQEFITQAERRKIYFPQPSTVQMKTMEKLSQVPEMFEVIKKNKADFVLLVIPNEHLILDTDDLYAVSKFCDMQDDQLTSQCVKGDNVMDTPKGYFNNLFDKINTKLGGVNSIVDPGYLRKSVPQLKMEESLVLGVDVNHPGELDRGGARISVAAAVASYDAHCTRYTCSMRIQLKERLETVMQMEEMMSNLLAEYRRHNKGKNPKNVIVFRDGVGDGHMSAIQQVEVTAIEKALAKASPTEEAIKLACIVVQKRHTVRFGLTEVNNSGYKPTYNVASGTVVDSYIVEPAVDGMVLNSHYSQLGTSRPSKYTVLRDDFQLSPDQLERLCFFACHACARSREPMSIPTPIKYADLLAFRAKVEINASQLLFQNKVGSAYQQHEEVVAKLSERIQVNERAANKMFYV